VNGSFLGRAGEPRDDEMVESVDPKSGAVAFGIASGGLDPIPIRRCFRSFASLGE